jgi:hypothetical protein
LIPELHYPLAKQANLTILPPYFFKRSAVQKPCKELLFGRCPNLPNLSSSGRCGCPIELSFVNGFRGLLTVIGEVPRYTMQNSLKKVDGPKLHPNGDVLVNVLERDIRFHVNL